MSALQPSLPQAAAKLDHYKWSEVGHQVPTRELPVRSLQVDMTYQRDALSEDKVLGIAGRWNFASAVVLTVSQRTDGSYWVVDGNHRREAALRRGDIIRLSCKVVTGLTVQQEAELFRQLNMYRTNVNSYTKYRSALVAGDAIVMACEAMLRRHGLKIQQDGDCPNILAFPQAIVQRFKASPETCEDALALLRAMIGDREQMTKDLHAGAFYILQRCDFERAMTLAPKALAAGGKPTLLQAVNATACQLGSVRSHERVAAIGILSILNRRAKYPLTLEE
jgi:hypothetical protein